MRALPAAAVECRVVVAADAEDSPEKLQVRTTILILLTCLAAAGCAQKQQTYETPEAAVQALMDAARSDEKALLGVLGSSAEPLINSGDAVADKNSRDRFVAKYDEAHSLDTSVANVATLEVGEDKYPFPIPLVLDGKRWRFDTEAGADELISRRVGANELATIQSCLAYVDAQREYYARNAPQDSMLHFAARLISTDGKKDGLYWPTESNEDPSPLGEEFAAARSEGYLKEGAPKPAPFHGYLYRTLTRQGSQAAGGAYDYLVNGQLLGGFALIAFPAEYGNSGVMTFMVNHDGVVFSKDLGAETAKLAQAIEAFDPGPDWKREEALEVESAAQ